MNKPDNVFSSLLEQEIFITLDFLKAIQQLRHTKETKVRMVNLLVQEEARIETARRELALG